MSGRGKPLELAISRSGRDYRKAGRAMLVRQSPPISNGPDGLLFYAGDAPIDFLGCVAGGRALALESKSTQRVSWPIAELRDDQREALGQMHRLGAHTAVILSFDEHQETYLLPWLPLFAFLENPWRESISVQWCRAHGLVIDETDRDDEKKRRCPFLEAKAHPERDAAREYVTEEEHRARERAAARPAPEPEQETLPMPSRHAGLTHEQRLDRILNAANDGVQRQLKDGTRRMVWRGGKAKRKGSSSR